MEATGERVDPRPLETRPKVRFFRAVNRLYCSTFQQLQVQTPCRLPRTGPAILVCNHMSGLDPLLLQAMSNRVIVWMMAKEYYEIQSIGWFFRMIEAIPVSRNGRDSSATRAALRALDAGKVLGIFPEGKIETDRNLMPFQTGVAMMAMKTGVPLYPAYLDGSPRGMEMLTAFRTAGRSHVRFGDPVKLSTDNGERLSLETATDRIRDGVETLKQDMERSRASGTRRRRLSPPQS
ncbi:MAG TPA: lysophospholipid acyltransferase family protein [Tepidisphaeraceae bacterium]|nr:lysophospholipid acyltransferase family protein [Tepidisphaeraceae bacterium]